MLAATRAAEALTESPRQMRIPGGGPDLAVSEQLGDHGQALAQRQRPRREGIMARPWQRRKREMAAETF